MSVKVASHVLHNSSQNPRQESGVERQIMSSKAHATNINNLHAYVQYVLALCLSERLANPIEIGTETIQRITSSRRSL